MYCSYCGAQLPEGAAFCGSCGRSVVGSAPDTIPAAAIPASYPAVPSYAPSAVAHRNSYAGFWLRFVALLIDSSLAVIIFGLLIGMRFATVGLPSFMMARRGFGFYGMVGPFPGFRFVWGLLWWLYSAILESSAWQATLGKKALGIYVTDYEGRRISFARATGRHFAKIISTLIFFIGYIMAGFTERKQALHDMIAHCLILKKH